MADKELKGKHAMLSLGIIFLAIGMCIFISCFNLEDKINSIISLGGSIILIIIGGIFIGNHNNPNAYRE